MARQVQSLSGSRFWWVGLLRERGVDSRFRGNLGFFPSDFVGISWYADQFFIRGLARLKSNLNFL